MVSADWLTTRTERVVGAGPVEPLDEQAANRAKRTNVRMTAPDEGQAQDTLVQAQQQAPLYAPTLDFEPSAINLAAALEHAPGTHTLQDLREGVASGAFQLWPGRDSAILTQIHVYPRQKVLCIYLAGGHLDVLHDMLPFVLTWARGLGCSSAFIAGRPGWARTFLKDEGWRQTQVILEKSL
jgi:hypothetical protein